MTAPPTDPVAQAKALKTAAVSLVVAGLIIGVGLPAILATMNIQVAMTPWGVDAIWLVLLAMMVVDFVIARWFWRRATALDRTAQGLPPRS
jgi:Na+-driven multidrug efflux pump